MIEFRNIYKKYGNNVIFNNFNETIQTGEFVFLVGTSGSGKSTLFKMLIKAEFPDKGQVLIDNYDLAKIKANQLPMLRRQVAVIFQDFKLIPNKTVAENLAFALDVQNLKINIPKKVDELLTLVKLQHRRSAIPRELSGGEKQRVAIARAMSTDPKILLADEPTGNLDPTSTWEIVRLLDEINKNGTTVIMATHDAEIVNTLNTRIIFLDNQTHLSFNDLSKKPFTTEFASKNKINEKINIDTDNEIQSKNITNAFDNLDFDTVNLQAKIQQTSLGFGQSILNELKQKETENKVNKSKLIDYSIDFKKELENKVFKNENLNSNNLKEKEIKYWPKIEHVEKAQLNNFEANNQEKAGNISKKSSVKLESKKQNLSSGRLDNIDHEKSNIEKRENLNIDNTSKLTKLETEKKLDSQEIKNNILNHSLDENKVSIFDKFKSLFSINLKPTNQVSQNSKNKVAQSITKNQTSSNQVYQPQMKFSFSLTNNLGQNDNTDELDILDIPNDIKRTLKIARVRKIKDLKMMSDFELNKLVGSLNSWKVKKAIEKIKL